MARTISYDKEPVTRFNEIFYDTTTKTTNTGSSSGAYSLGFASTTDFTVASEDFPGDLVSGTNIQKGSRVVAKDASSITLNKPITGAISSGDSVTLYSSMKGLDGGPQGFALLEGNGITLTPTNSNNAGVPTVTLASTASGADGMGSGFTVSATTDTTATTITQGDDLFFAASGGLTAETTADGTVTHGLDINGLTEAAIASGDMIAFSDEGATNDPTRRESIDDVAALFAGAGLTATNAVIAVDADQSGQITAVGTLTGLTVSGAADLNNNLTVDGATISLDATTSLNIDNSNTSNGITIGTATSGVPISIGHTTSEVTINDNLTVTGNLTVDGTTTTDTNVSFNVTLIVDCSSAQPALPNSTLNISVNGNTPTSVRWLNGNLPPASPDALSVYLLGFTIFRNFNANTVDIFGVWSEYPA